jgi:hypothetical protein
VGLVVLRYLRSNFNGIFLECQMDTTRDS